MAKSLHTPTYRAFSKMMRQAREAAGFTQKELAKKLGKQQSFISKFENCERRIDLLEFIDLCAALGIDPSNEVRKVKGLVRKR